MTQNNFLKSTVGLALMLCLSMNAWAQSPDDLSAAEEAANREAMMREMLYGAMSHTNALGEIIRPQGSFTVPMQTRGSESVDEPSQSAGPSGIPALPEIPGIPEEGLVDGVKELSEEELNRILSTGAAAPVIAPKEGSGEEVVQVNAPEMPMDQALNLYASLTGRILLRQTTIPGAPTAVHMVFDNLSKEEAIEAFNAVFAMEGLAMLPVGEKFLKVVPANAAPGAGTRFDERMSGIMAETGQFVRKIIQLKNADVAEVAQILAPFASQQAGGNAVTALESNQILVLQDYSPNVKRMLELVAKVDVDVPLDVEIELIPIKYALAGDIGQVIGSLSANGSVTPTGGSSSGLSSRGVSGSNTRGSTRGRNTNTLQNNSTTGAHTTSSTANRSTFQSRLRGIVNRASQGDIQVLGDAKIIPDEESNTILVFANKKDMEMIKMIISKLDVVRPQVLIEAIIMEVTLGDELDLGVSAIQKDTSGNWQGVLGSSGGAVAPADPSGDLGINDLFEGLSYFGGTESFSVAVKAIAKNNEAHILQRPRIQTFHAKEASLFVGEMRPFVTSRYTGFGTSSPSSNVSRERIGVELNVLPLINPDGLVVMEIEQIIEAVGSTVIIDGNPVPVTTERTATSSVAVKDGEVVILGGMISDEISDTESGVPFLKDIPLLGRLFKSTNKQKRRVELVILIKPTVLPTPEISSTTATAEVNKMLGVKHAEALIIRDQLEREKELSEAIRKIEE